MRLSVEESGSVMPVLLEVYCDCHPATSRKLRNRQRLNEQE